MPKGLAACPLLGAGCSSSEVGTGCPDVGAWRLLLRPSGVVIGRAPTPPRCHTNLQPLPKVSLRGGRDFEAPASPQYISSVPRAAGRGKTTVFVMLRKTSREAWLLFHLDLLSVLTSSVSWLL